MRRAFNKDSIRVTLLFLVRFAVTWALYSGFYWLCSQLPTPWRWLVFLSAVLFTLIHATGESNKRYPNRWPIGWPIGGPVTLAGPIQPWQEVNHG